MKKLILAMLLSVGVAQAGTLSFETCEDMNTFARMLMHDRQNGVELAQLMVLQELKPYQGIIIEAYGVPRYNTAVIQEKKIIDFTNKVYLQCIQGDRKYMPK